MALRGSLLEGFMVDIAADDLPAIAKRLDGDQLRRKRLKVRGSRA